MDEDIIGLQPWVVTFFRILPLIVVAWELLYHSLRYFVRTPSWLKPLVTEPTNDETINVKLKSSLSLSTLCLLGLTVAGLVAQVWLALRSPGAIVLLVAWGLAVVNVLLQRPATSPVLTITFFTCIVGAQSIILADRSNQSLSDPINAVGIISAVIAALAATVGMNMPLREPTRSSEGISQPFTTPTSSFRSPEDNMTLWQWMTVSWMTPMLKVGSKRQLNEPDVWNLPYEFQEKHMHNAFREVQGSVMGRLIRANWIDLVILAGLALIELVATFCQPLLLQQLLLAIQITDVTVQPAIMYGFLNLIASVTAAQSTLFSLWFGRRTYERTRGVLIMMLFDKTMRRKVMSSSRPEDVKQDDLAHESLPSGTQETELSSNANANEATETTPLLNGSTIGQPKTEISTPTRWTKIRGVFTKLFSREKAKVEPKNEVASMGKIINMMRTDAYEIAQRFWDSQQLLKKPLGLILALTLTWQVIGWSVMLGVVIVVFAQVLNFVLARFMVTWERKRRKMTDERIQTTSQFVEGIRHLRWYGWQSYWIGGILDARHRELRTRVITSCLRMGINITSIVASAMLPVVSFYAYTEIAGKQLTVDVAFAALALFDLLQRELRDLPQLVTSWLNAMVGVYRIEEFMQESDRAENDDVSPLEDCDLQLNDATFAWPGTNKTVLRNVSLSFEPGLNVIFGEVGSGKTALLQALLGELDLVSGQLSRPYRPIAYCTQTPWLQSMSIRDNILFSAPFDSVRYRATIEACALVPDFESFKDGDLSEIGENGIGLSGGQKARVALARAVYSRTDILLLDDPFSALDQQTAEWIASRCLNGHLMEGRVVVLITHRTDLCHGIAKQMIEITDHTARVSDEKMAMLAAVRSHEAPPAVDAKETGKAPDEPVTKFIEDEHRAVGSIKWSVYWEFIVAGGTWTWTTLMIVDIGFHFFIFLRNAFIVAWGEAYGSPDGSTSLFLYSTTPKASILMEPGSGSTPLSRWLSFLPNPAVNPGPWLIGLTIIVLVQSANWLADQMVMVVLIYTTGKKMFKEVLNRVANAKFRFYDVTPTGRLLNRMVSDVSALDGSISGTLSNFLFWASSWALSVVALAASTPFSLIAAVLLTISYVLIFQVFIPTSQSLRRLETVSLSPLMSNFAALLEGLTTVRAYHAQARFQSAAIAATDIYQKMDHFYWSLQGWLQYRFEILSDVSTFAMTVIAIFTGLSPGLTAFVLRAASKLVMTTNAVCRDYARLQLDFISVERVVELFHIDQEPKGSIEPPGWWPSTSSDIVFEDVVIRYAPNLDPALAGVSFTLSGGSNTAVIGRTGSGKSTLALALLGTIVPDSGRILIGGIDISQVNKQALRSRVSFLAQDPVLFPGTMRKNLDPTGAHSNEDCSQVLERVCGRFNWTLDMEIDAGGKNLSQGQRQLVGLCRAILRRSAIIIMDEATASIDKESAWEIQRVLRVELKQSTVITIAHRKEAVRGADYVLSLAKGKLVEQGKLGDVDDLTEEM